MCTTALVLCCACGAPRADSSASLPSETELVAAAVRDPGEPSPGLLRRIDRLAARVDMLRLQGEDLSAFADHGSPEEQRAMWRRAVTAFGLRLEEFLEDHPDLGAVADERLRRTVLEPFRAIRAEND